LEYRQICVYYNPHTDTRTRTRVNVNAALHSHETPAKPWLARVIVEPTVFELFGEVSHLMWG